MVCSLDFVVFPVSFGMLLVCLKCPVRFGFCFYTCSWVFVFFLKKMCCVWFCYVLGMCLGMFSGHV